MSESNKMNNEEQNFEIKNDIDDFSEFKFPLDSTSTPEISSSKELVTIAKAKEVEDTDFSIARTNILDIVEQGGDVLESMISLAKASDHPRAYEVVGSLMKTLTEANKDLLDLHERKSKLNSDVPENQTNIQNNTLMVGTTKELLDMLKKTDHEDGEIE